MDTGELGGSPGRFMLQKPEDRQLWAVGVVKIYPSCNIYVSSSYCKQLVTVNFLHVRSRRL